VPNTLIVPVPNKLANFVMKNQSQEYTKHSIYLETFQLYTYSLSHFQSVNKTENVKQRET